MMSIAFALLATLLLATNANSSVAHAQSMRPENPSLINRVDAYFTVTAWQEADTECGDVICYYAAPIVLNADSLTGVYIYSRYYYGSPQEAWHSELEQTYQGVAVTNAYDYFSDWTIGTSLEFYNSNGSWVTTQSINSTNCAVGYGTAVNCGYTYPWIDFYDYKGNGIVVHHENIFVDDDFGVDHVWTDPGYGWYMTSFCNYSPYNCW
jgi:hypothetical protein